MADSFDLCAYGERVDKLVMQSVASMPESDITYTAMRELLLPYVDALSEDLPTLDFLPSPEHVESVAHRLGGVMLRLETTPTMGDINEYTGASTDTAVEVSLSALPNGLTVFAIGTTDRSPLLPEFQPLELLASAALHTHPNERAPGTECMPVDVHAARVPSAGDIDHAANIGPSAQYIADKYGLTYYTSPSVPVSVKDMLELYMPTLDISSRAEFESVLYPAFAARFSNVQMQPWDRISPEITLHDLVSHSTFRTEDHVSQGVFSRA